MLDYHRATSRFSADTKHIALTLAWCVIGIGMFATTAAFVAMANVVSYLWLFFLLLMLASAAFAAAVRRRRRVQAIIGYLDQASRLNLPLPTMLAAAARSERGRTRRCLERLELALVEGRPLHESLLLALPEMPEAQRRQLAMAESLGQLAPTLTRLARRHQEIDHTAIPMLLPYAAAMLLLISISGGFILVFLIPKFEMILNDFRVEAPNEMFWLITLGRSIGAPLLVFSALFCIYKVGQWLRDTVHVNRGLTFLQPMRDRAVWLTPLLHTIERDRNLSDVCQQLASATRSGISLERALMETAQLHINGSMHQKLWNWLTGIENGLSPADASRHAGLPTFFSGALATAQAGGDLAHLFEFFGSYYATRHSRLLALARATVIPLVTLFFAVVVLMVMLAVFRPIIALIWAALPIGGRI